MSKFPVCPACSQPLPTLRIDNESGRYDRYIFDDHFVESLSDEGYADYLAPRLDFTFDNASDGVIPFNNQREILPPEQFEALVLAVRRFYDSVGPGYISEHNKKAQSEIKRQFFEQQAKEKAVPGWVYLLRSDAGHYKIGKSRSPKKRAHDFTVKLPFPVEVLHLIRCEDHTAAERLLHEKFAERRGNGEWFDLNEGDVAYIKAIRTISAKGMLNE